AGVGRAFAENEMRMQAIGFAPYPYRLPLYVIAGILCGLAGFLLGNQAEFVSPAYMHWQRSGELILMVLLGGTGTLYGPILGALTFSLLEEVLSRLTEHWKAILGPLLILLVLFANGGIAGAIESWRRGNLDLARRRAALLGAVTETLARLARWRREIASSTRRLGEAGIVRIGGIAGAIEGWRRHLDLARRSAALLGAATETLARLARWHGEVASGARR